MSRSPHSIPVIMYHGVGKDHPGWAWNHYVHLFEGKPFSIWKYLCHTLEYVFRHQVMGTE